MATVIRVFDVDTDPAHAWEALSDFGALHQRLSERTGKRGGSLTP